jgi:hypothetical protein
MVRYILLLLPFGDSNPMLERLLAQRACLQSIDLVPENIQLPLHDSCESQMSVHSSIAPKLGQLLPQSLVLVVVFELVVLVLVVVFELLMLLA